MMGIVAACAGDDRDTSAHGLDHMGDDCQMFFVRHGGCFTGGTCDDDGVSAVLDVEFTQLGHGIKMDTRFGKRCDNGDTRSLEQGLFHKVVLQEGFILKEADDILAKTLQQTKGQGWKALCHDTIGYTLPSILAIMPSYDQTF